jgi:hypothetical protein
VIAGALHIIAARSAVAEEVAEEGVVEAEAGSCRSC